MSQYEQVLDQYAQRLLAAFEHSTFAAIFTNWWWIMLIFVGAYLLVDLVGSLIEGHERAVVNVGCIFVGVIMAFVFVFLLRNLWFDHNSHIDYGAPFYYEFFWALMIFVVVITVASIVSNLIRLPFRRT